MSQLQQMKVSLLTRFILPTYAQVQPTPTIVHLILVEMTGAHAAPPLCQWVSTSLHQATLPQCRKLSMTVTSLSWCWSVVVWVAQHLNSTPPSKSWGWEQDTGLWQNPLLALASPWLLTLASRWNHRDQRIFTIASWKKAFAQIHLLGKTIKLICEVTLNLLQLTPDSSCQEFDWQFLFIYILLYNICLNVVNFSDWNFTVSAWIFIDHKIICTTR